MLKEMLLIKRKDGLSMEDFVKHYEEVHAPLIMRMCPSVRKYARNYVTNTLGAQGPGFDCITEVWYENIDGFKALGKIYMSEEGKAIRESEDRFMDSQLVVFLVDEKVSE